MSDRRTWVRDDCRDADVETEFGSSVRVLLHSCDSSSNDL